MTDDPRDFNHMPEEDKGYHYPQGSVICEAIHRLRRLVLLHSRLYYRDDFTVVSDHQFDDWAYQLVRLQEAFPKESEQVTWMYDAFKDFDGSTGFHLPLEDTWVMRAADRMIWQYESIRRRGW